MCIFLKLSVCRIRPHITDNAQLHMYNYKCDSITFACTRAWFGCCNSSFVTSEGLKEPLSQDFNYDVCYCKSSRCEAMATTVGQSRIIIIFGYAPCNHSCTYNESMPARIMFVLTDCATWHLRNQIYTPINCHSFAYLTNCHTCVVHCSMHS